MLSQVIACIVAGRVSPIWCLCSVGAPLVAGVTKPYAEWCFHPCVIPLWGFLPLYGVGWRWMELGCAKGVTINFKGDHRVPRVLVCAPPASLVPTLLAWLSDVGWQRSGLATRGGMDVQWSWLSGWICCSMAALVDDWWMFIGLYPFLGSVYSVSVVFGFPFPRFYCWKSCNVLTDTMSFSEIQVGTPWFDPKKVYSVVQYVMVCYCFCTCCYF
jgi:hypothetical protein